MMYAILNEQTGELKQFISAEDSSKYLEDADQRNTYSVMAVLKENVKAGRGEM